MRVGIYAVELATGGMGVSFEFGNKHAYISGLRDAKIIAGFLNDVIRVLECPLCEGRSALFEGQKCARCGSLEHG